MEENVIKAPHLETSQRFISYSCKIDSYLKFEDDPVYFNPKNLKLQNEALLQFLRFLGRLKGLGDSELIRSLEPKVIVKKLLENTFREDSGHNIDLFKRCCLIFNFDKVKLVLEHISVHKYNF